MPQPSDLINITQAAEILGISPRATLRRIRTGALPARKFGNGGTSPYAIRRGDVEKLVERALADRRSDRAAAS